MRDIASQLGLLTFEEFLDIEAHSDIRHEFVGGVLHAMAGASRRHNRIVWNVVAALTPAARNADCDVLASDMLTRVGEAVAYYPDVSVICDSEDTNERYAERPCLVVEVTSPSSVDRDQREKLLSYRGIESLQTYLVVFQEEQRVIHHWRTASGGWEKVEIAGDELIELPCPGTTLSLDDIYRRVKFDAG